MPFAASYSAHVLPRRGGHPHRKELEPQSVRARATQGKDTTMMILYFHSWSRLLMRAAGFDILARGSARLARRLAAVGRQRTAILTLQRLDDRTLADIGVLRGEIEFAAGSGAPARNPRPAQAASRAEIYAFARRRAA
jgi:uncharacterized protein YjiS (DUF1127 family)